MVLSDSPLGTHFETQKCCFQIPTKHNSPQPLTSPPQIILVLFKIKFSSLTVCFLPDSSAKTHYRNHPSFWKTTASDNLKYNMVGNYSLRKVKKKNNGVVTAPCLGIRHKWLDDHFNFNFWNSGSPSIGRKDSFCLIGF